MKRLVIYIAVIMLFAVAATPLMAFSQLAPPFTIHGNITSSGVGVNGVTVNMIDTNAGTVYATATTGNGPKGLGSKPGYFSFSSGFQGTKYTYTATIGGVTWSVDYTASSTPVTLADADLTPTLPVAGFSMDQNSGSAPLTVQFTDGSSGFPAYWNWSFGDGSLNSSAASPSHTYTTAGVYTAILTVFNLNGSNTITKTITVHPVASFTEDHASGNVPLTVQFTDASKGLNSSSTYDWNFGDGSVHATMASPSHIFSAAGKYTVTLTVTMSNGDSNSYTQLITVNPVASFSVDKSSGNSPLTVQFTDASLGSPATYDWDFGDGSVHATMASPSHIFSVAGKHTVTLTVTTSDGLSSTSTQLITVNPVAGFSVDKSSGNSPLTVQFTDACLGSPATYDWNFGDGSADSALASPSHVFSIAGTYTVTLTVTTSDGLSSTSTPQTITVKPVAKFTVDKSSGPAPLTVQFTDASVGDSTSKPFTYHWDFGDGTGSSTSWNPSYTYSSLGTYTVTEKVTSNDGTVFAIATKDIVVGPTLVYPVASFTTDVASGNAPLTVSFTDTSSGAPISWAWNFGDGSANVTTQNAAHTFTKTGTFNVILTVTNTNGTDSIMKTVSVNKYDYTINLKAGWNIISFPVDNNTIMASDLASLGVTDVFAFNGTMQWYDQWYNASDNSTSDFALVPGVGYMVKCSQDTSFIVTGNGLVGQTTALAKGWNLVGWSTMDAKTASSLVTHLNGGQTVFGWDASQQFFTHMYPLSADFTMSPGYGYFIESPATATLDYDYVIGG